MISIVSGAVPIKLYRLTFIFLACPPTPAATIYGFAVALGLLDQKLKAESHEETPGEQATLKHTGIPLEMKVIIEREARRLAGYRQGQAIADEFMELLVASTPETVDKNLRDYLAAKDDPRLKEIVENLYRVSMAELCGRPSAEQQEAVSYRYVR